MEEVVLDVSNGRFPPYLLRIPGRDLTFLSPFPLTRLETRRQAQRVLDPSDPETTERMLNSTLKSMGLYASKTVGDGNCMFRALSDQVWGNDNGHLGLRQEVGDWV
jgi:OTU domain-containing protein 3